MSRVTGPLETPPHLLVVGPRNSGRTAVLRRTAFERIDRGDSVVIVGDESEFADFESVDDVLLIDAFASGGPDSYSRVLDAVVEYVGDELTKRNFHEGPSKPISLLVDDLHFLPFGPPFRYLADLAEIGVAGPALGLSIVASARRPEGLPLELVPLVEVVDVRGAA